MSSKFSAFFSANKILISLLLFPPSFPSSSSLLTAQSSPARWIVAKKVAQNGEKGEHPKHGAAFEQKWGQSLVTAASPPIGEFHSNSNSSSSPNLVAIPQLLDWKEWENMSNESVVELQRNGRRQKALGSPILIVAKEREEGGLMRGKGGGNSGGILPAEAEEEAEEDEGGWKEGWAHFERKLTAGTVPFNLTPFPVEIVGKNGNETIKERGNLVAKNEAEISTEMPAKLETVDFIKFSNKFTTPTTPMPEYSMAGGLNATNFAGLDAPTLLGPFGQNIPIQAQNGMDLRQLPSLMHLLKQIPTVIRTFQENPSASAGSFGEKIGGQNNGGDFFALPSGNGLIQQFLGASKAGQVSKIQSRAVSNEYGGLGQMDIEGKMRGMGAGEEVGIGTNGEGMIDGGIVDNSQIVPILTTNAGIPVVGRIDIRRLPPSNRPIPKMGNIFNETTIIAAKGLRVEKEWKNKISEKERQQRLNIYGVTLAPASAYEAPFPLKNSPTTVNWEKLSKKRPRPQFDIGKLTVGELGQLEKIHRKLFNAENGEITNSVRKEHWELSRENANNGHSIFNQIESPPNITKSMGGPSSPPRQLPSNSGTNQQANLRELVRKGVEIGQLDQSMLNDLLAIGELPDLEEMTRGMDLSLLHKPGGFAILKQQFVERLIQRALIGKGRRKS